MLESLEPSLGYGGAGNNDRLPRILAEIQGLTISGPYAGAAAGVAIPVPDNNGIQYNDTILKVLMFAAGVPSDVTSDASIVDLRAFGTITVLTTVVDGDTVTVNGKVYTFKQATVTPSYDIPPFVVPINVGPSGIDSVQSLLHWPCPLPSCRETLPSLVQ
jgi:hypothetical protein